MERVLRLNIRSYMRIASVYGVKNEIMVTQYYVDLPDYRFFSGGGFFVFVVVQNDSVELLREDFESEGVVTQKFQIHDSSFLDEFEQSPAALTPYMHEIGVDVDCTELFVFKTHREFVLDLNNGFQLVETDQHMYFMAVPPETGIESVVNDLESKHLYFEEVIRSGILRRLAFETQGHIDIFVRDLSYATRRRHGVQLLRSIFLKTLPGEVLGIMGISGSSKSTLLDKLSGRIESGELSGSYYADGMHINSVYSLSGLISYLPQADVINGALTVEEAIRFTAYLRLRLTMDQAENLADYFIRELGLWHRRKSHIVSLSGGELKRVHIGFKLLSSSMLFLGDEITTGLDASNAKAVLQLVRNINALKHIPTVLSVHQPRTEALALFDKIVVLVGGRVIAYGTVDSIMNLIAEEGYPIADNKNPADALIEALTSSEGNPLVLPDQSLTKIRRSGRAVFMEEAAEHERRYETNEPVKTAFHITVPFTRQLFTLLSREWRVYTRNRSFFFARFLLMIVMALLAAFTFFQIPNTQRGIATRFGSLFFLLLLVSFSPVQAIISSFQAEKEVLRRELFEKFFSPFSYFLAKTLLGMIGQLFFPLVFSLIVYWIIGFQPSFTHFLIFYMALFFAVACAESWGFFIAAVSNNMLLAQILGPLTMTLFFLYAGFFTSAAGGESTGPLGVISWVRYISFLTYSYEIILDNEFAGLAFTCTPDELVGDQCPFTDGDAVLDFYGFGNVNIGINVVFLGIIYFVMRLLIYLSIKFSIRIAPQWRSKIKSPNRVETPLIVPPEHEPGEADVFRIAFSPSTASVEYY
ncbi:hypothetical protein PCE1_004101 [Barthelona sp. PCE]